MVSLRLQFIVLSIFFVRPFEWSLYLQWFFHIEEDHGQNNNHTYKHMQCEGEIDLSGIWLWMCGEYPRCYPQEVT